MATTGTNTMGVLEAASMYTKDGQILAVAEVLNTVENLDSDLHMTECDTAEGHMSGRRTSLPTLSVERHNEGEESSVATQEKALEKTMGVAGWSKIEDKIANYGGNPAAKRSNQDMAFVEKMRQDTNAHLLYANHAVDPDTIDGFLTRYSTKTGNIGRNVLLAKDAAGSDYASILLVGHGKRTVYGLYPKGTPAGISMEDFGRKHHTIDGKEFVFWSKKFSRKFGIAIDDSRFVVRIANIDISDLTGATPPNLRLLMQQAIDLIPDPSGVRLGFYMPRQVKSWLADQFYTGVKAGGGITFDNVTGRHGVHKMMHFQEIPINTQDSMSIAEGRVV